MARHVDHAHLKAKLIMKITDKLAGFAALKVATAARVEMSFVVIDN